jgi:hypothetical protein
MSEQPQQDAPVVGQGTDAQDVDADLDLEPDEATIETPDELGGTGGEQPGGAG